MVLVEGQVSLAANDDGEWKHLAVSAVSEAFNNVVLHAYAERDGEVAVEIEPTEGALVVRLIDDGKTFDPAVIPAPELETLPEGGMGLYIMREAVDEVAYQAGPPNVLRLTKLRRTSVGGNEPRGDEPVPSGDRYAQFGLEGAEASEALAERPSGMRTLPPGAPEGAPAEDPLTHETRASAKSGFRSKTVPPPEHAARDPRRA